MICYSCSHKVVCKHFYDIHSVGIEISKCKHHSETIEPVINNITSKNNSISKARESVANYRKNLNSNTKQPLRNKINCPSCGGIDYEDEIKVCSICLKPVCGNCSTVIDGEELVCDDCNKKETK